VIESGDSGRKAEEEGKGRESSLSIARGERERDHKKSRQKRPAAMSQGEVQKGCDIFRGRLGEGEGNAQGWRSKNGRSPPAEGKRKKPRHSEKRIKGRTDGIC